MFDHSYERSQRWNNYRNATYVVPFFKTQQSPRNRTYLHFSSNAHENRESVTSSSATVACISASCSMHMRKENSICLSVRLLCLLTKKISLHIVCADKTKYSRTFFGACTNILARCLQHLGFYHRTFEHSYEGSYNYTVSRFLLPVNHKQQSPRHSNYLQFCWNLRDFWDSLTSLEATVACIM